MQVIDFRVRPPLRSFLNCGFFTDASNPFDWHSPPPKSVREKSFEALRAELLNAGISGAVIWGRKTTDSAKSTKDEDVAEIRASNPDIFLAGFGALCPDVEHIGTSLDAIERAAGLGLKGMTLEPGIGMRPLTHADDRALFPIYESLQDHRMLLALTISRGVSLDQTLALSNPEAVDKVSRAFPDLKIVVSHAFWPWVEHSCGLAFRRPNVYLLPDLYGMGMPGTTMWVEAANTGLADKILFASAYPYLGVEEMVSAYMRLPYKDSVREKVMRTNALQLLSS